MLNLTAAIIFGIAMIILMLGAFRACNGGKLLVKSQEGYIVGISPFDGINAGEVAISVFVGIMVFCFDYFAMRLNVNSLWVAWVFAGVLMLTTIGVMMWSSATFGVVDSLFFIAIFVLLYLVTKPITLMAAASVFNGWYTLLTLLPLAFMLIAITREVVVFFYRFSKTRENGWLFQIIAVIAAIVGIVILIFSFIIPSIKGFNGPSIPRYADSGAEQPVNNDDGVVEANDVIWHFYNLDLQADGDTANDYNFGPTPSGEYPDGIPLEGWKVSDEAAPYLANLMLEMVADPVKGTGIVAAHDHLLEKQMVGYLWSNDEELNNIVNYYIVNPGLYYRMYDCFFSEAKERASISLKNFEQGTLTSQEYQNPHTEDGIPDLVIAESHDRGGLALVFDYGDGKELILRIACDFQPCNVEGTVINPDPYEPPTPEPTPQPTPTPPTPVPPRPVPPEPETYHKDPGDANFQYLEPNDDPGPGINTNNGVGSTESTMDLPTNSGSFSSYEEYKDTVGELESVNESQQTGRDDNTPSYTPPVVVEPVPVDNNGDTGNNGAPINTPTPVQEPAVVAGTGQEINTQPAGEWGGPPD